jgi:hypothetical protein
VGKWPAGGDRSAVAGVQRLDRIGAAEHGADLGVVVEEGQELLPGVAPQLPDGGVGRAPLLFELLERRPRGVPGGGPVDGFEVGRDLTPVLLLGVLQRVPDQMDDTCLHHSLGKHGADRVRQPFEAVADDEEDVQDASVLQLAQHLKPELR